MRNEKRIGWPALLLGAWLAAGCVAGGHGERVREAHVSMDERLHIVAESDRRWTGVAVSQEGRIFVNYPRWSDDVPISVAEVTAFREVRPFPDPDWNRWEPGLDPAAHFVCVQSVVVDDRNRLWVLDPANPKFEGVVHGGPKLVEIDPATSQVLRTILFPSNIAPRNSYLNDVRIDTAAQRAYITDSGSGALVVVDLTSGHSRRLLTDHPSTQSEGIELTIGGEPWLRNGEPPHVHADGIALSPDRQHLYFQALTGRTLYRISTEALRHEYLTGEELGKRVERVGETGAADGILFGPDGSLYLTALEESAIRRLTPDGRLETVVHDPHLSWPDSMAFTPEGDLLVTTAQIHLGDAPPEPYRIFRVRP